MKPFARGANLPSPLPFAAASTGGATFSSFLRFSSFFRSLFLPFLFPLLLVFLVFLVFSLFPLFFSFFLVDADAAADFSEDDPRHVALRNDIC